MALVTTVGDAASDSYGTLAAYQAYGANMGWTLGADDAADEINLRRATMTLDRQYGFTGCRVAQTQALAWPRYIDTLVDGFYISSTTIPQDIINAQFELAYLIQGGFDPFKNVSGSVKEAGAGPTKVVFQGGYSTERVVAVEGILAPYLSHGRGQVRVVRG